MRFVYIRSLHAPTIDRVTYTGETFEEFKKRTGRDSVDICIGFLQASNTSLDPDKEFQLVFDYDSYQIRTRSLYRNTKGTYYKEKNSKKVYISKENERELQEYIEGIKPKELKVLQDYYKRYSYTMPPYPPKEDKE